MIRWLRHVMAVLLAAGFFSFFPTDSAAADFPPTRVAIMEFATEDTTQRGCIMGELIMAELIMAELLATGGYEIIERLQLEKATEELHLQGTGQIDPLRAPMLEAIFLWRM